MTGAIAESSAISACAGARLESTSLVERLPYMTRRIFTRPLVYTDDDVRTVQHALGDFPTIMIHGSLVDDRFLNVRLTAWNVIGSEDPVAISVD